MEKIEMIKSMWAKVKKGGRLIIQAPNKMDIPFQIASYILKKRHKWNFGEEDDLTAKRMAGLFKAAGIEEFETFAYNPIVGWWFFPFGKEITGLIGVNEVVFHKAKTPFGHVLQVTAVKK
jgi:hypothetical protein